jgi:hypothetical protein
MGGQGFQRDTKPEVCLGVAYGEQPVVAGKTAGVEVKIELLLRRLYVGEVGSCGDEPVAPRLMSRATLELPPSAPISRRQRNAMRPFEPVTFTATASLLTTQLVSWHPSIIRAPALRAERPGDKLLTRDINCAAAANIRLCKAVHLQTPSASSSNKADGPTKSPQTLSRGKVMQSRRMTEAPSRVRLTAAAAPAGPAPAIITSES